MAYRKDFFYSKKAAFIILLCALIVLSTAFWYGGREKWELTGLGPETVSNPSMSAAYAEKLKQNPHDPVFKYNLAYFYYRQNRFDEAEKLLLEILGSSRLDAGLIQKVSYNLGNSLFRLSEETEDNLQAIELLKRSLDQYRAVIEYDKERQQYISTQVEIDQDAKYNYAVVKNRIKILVDQQRQEKETQQRKKELFVLLKELLAEEKQIKTQLQLLQSAKSTPQGGDLRNSLLKKRAQNLKLLKVLEARIKQMIQPQKTTTPSAPII